jgi:primosomal protein N' (replication factor Y)
VKTREAAAAGMRAVEGAPEPTEPSQGERLVSVAVPVPSLDRLTYHVPAPLPTPVPGARVIVPLGARTLTGIVTAGVPERRGDVALRDVVDVLDRAPFLPPDVLELTAWVADYYLAGPGAVLAAAVPPRALGRRVDAFRTRRLVALTAEGEDLAARVALDPRCSPDAITPRLGTRQREALLVLRGSRAGVGSAELASRGMSAAVVSRLRAMGLVTIRHERLDRDPFRSGRGALDPVGREQAASVAHAPRNAGDRGSPDPAHTRRLTGEQEAALSRLSGLLEQPAFSVALLHGVTGSGKTEIYLHLAGRVGRSGRGALILVPEIALTPAMAAGFRAWFGARVAIQHSGLSDGERHDQWHRIRRGDVDVVVGTRSAVFAPLARPGLIVVDEEHDASYKQDETPRYHGRDVAVMRGKLAGALVVLGSATPSMESHYNALRGRYAKVTLARRVLDRPLADVRIVNMREEYAAEGPDVVVSRPLRAAIGARLERREQVVLLLNRRGYATSVFCRQCGGVMDCPNCSVSLTVYTGTRTWRARCHYCNHTRLVPRQCPACAAPYLQHMGVGTERVESEIARLFPSVRLARIDRDSVRRRGQLTDLLHRFARGDLDVLVGTQMIAKGHDFPQVTLVGVISADVGLGVADFRAAERTFQLLTQVAGRAGRGGQTGEAVIQTLFPEHYSIRLATAQDYDAFFEREIAFRRAMRYPPIVSMINVVVRGRSFAEAMNRAADLAGRVRERVGPSAIVLGPAPAPLTRLRGSHRAQFFLKGTARAAMRQAIRDALAGLPDIARKASVDVDPLSVL